jgi:plastocyanin
MSAEPYCRDAQQGGADQRQRVRLGSARGVADVIVHVKGVAAAATPVTAREPVVLDQKGCMYEPRVLALRVGDALRIRNSDNVMHNVHARGNRNPSFNLGQPMAGLEARRTFRAAELPISVKCDVHDWMEASIAVFDHSFFAVTSTDGRFTIQGLPPGEYEIEAWHPVLGARTQRVRTGTGVTEVEVKFEK